MQEQFRQDVWVCRTVAITLGLSVLASLTGGIPLTLQYNQPPEVLVALRSAVVGRLAGSLAPSPLNR